MNIRVELPQHLRTLAQVGREVQLEVGAPVTLRAVIDALEASYPVLRGTIRDHGTQQRRAFLRFFACEDDLSHQSPDAPLPDAVVSGRHRYRIHWRNYRNVVRQCQNKDPSAQNHPGREIPCRTMTFR